MLSLNKIVFPNKNHYIWYDSSKKEQKIKVKNVTITHNHSILSFNACTFLLLLIKVDYFCQPHINNKW